LRTPNRTPNTPKEAKHFLNFTKKNFYFGLGTGAFNLFMLLVWVHLTYKAMIEENIVLTIISIGFLALTIFFFIINCRQISEKFIMIDVASAVLKAVEYRTAEKFKKLEKRFKND